MKELEMMEIGRKMELQLDISKSSGVKKREAEEDERTGDDGNWPENGVATGY